MAEIVFDHMRFKSISGKELVLVGFDGVSEKLLIPAEINGKIVVAIKFCSGLRRVKKLQLSEGILVIEKEAFSKCAELEEVILPDSLQIIDSNAFAECSFLRSVKFGKHLAYLSPSAFNNCPSLSSIQVDRGNPVYSDGENRNVVIEKGSDTLVLGCKDSVIPGYVRKIGDDAFYGKGATEILIPEGVVSLGRDVFHDCHNLRKITLPDSLKTNGYEGALFENCTSLKEIFIPRQFGYIEDDAFLGCDSLARIRVDKRNPVYDSRNDCNGIIETKKNCLYLCCETTRIPDTVTSVYPSAFNQVGSLKSVFIPKSVKEVLKSYYCKNKLKTIYFESEELPKGWKENIGQIEAILMMSADKEFYFSSRPTKSNTEESDEESAEKQNGTLGGLCFIRLRNHTWSVSCIDKEKDEIVIPDVIEGAAVTEIQEGGFKESKVSSIILPKSLEKINSFAFYGCQNLRKIAIPKYVREIGKSAFAGTHLEKIYFSHGLEVISQEAFADCSFENLDLPDGLIKIDSKAFDGCGKLEKVYIPESVCEIGDSAFPSDSGMQIVCAASSKPDFWSDDWCDRYSCEVTWDSKQNGYNPNKLNFFDRSCLKEQVERADPDSLRSITITDDINVIREKFKDKFGFDDDDRYVYQYFSIMYDFHSTIQELSKNEHSLLISVENGMIMPYDYSKNEIKGSEYGPMKRLYNNFLYNNYIFYYEQCWNKVKLTRFQTSGLLIFRKSDSKYCKK